MNKLYISGYIIFTFAIVFLAGYSLSLKKKADALENEIKAAMNEISELQTRLIFSENETIKCQNEISRQNEKIALYNEENEKNIKLFAEEKKSLQAKYEALQKKYSNRPALTCEEQIKDISEIYKTFLQGG